MSFRICILFSVHATITNLSSRFHYCHSINHDWNDSWNIKKGIALPRRTKEELKWLNRLLTIVGTLVLAVIVKLVVDSLFASNDIIWIAYFALALAFLLYALYNEIDKRRSKQ